jgi:hypothetical protein
LAAFSFAGRGAALPLRDGPQGEEIAATPVRPSRCAAHLDAGLYGLRRSYWPLRQSAAIRQPMPVLTRGGASAAIHQMSEGLGKVYRERCPAFPCHGPAGRLSAPPNNFAGLFLWVDRDLPNCLRPGSRGNRLLTISVQCGVVSHETFPPCTLAALRGGLLFLGRLRRDTPRG